MAVLGAVNPRHPYHWPAARKRGELDWYFIHGWDTLRLVCQMINPDEPFNGLPAFMPVARAEAMREPIPF